MQCELASSKIPNDPNVIELLPTLRALCKSHKTPNYQRQIHILASRAVGLRHPAARDNLTGVCVEAALIRIRST